MSKLSQFLVDGILNEAESDVVTAVFGGGFKPPTKGHLEVVLKAIKENPEIDQVYIIVGSGVRNGISQEQSIKIWEKYKSLIPKTTEIIEAGSPLNWIKDYLKDHTEDKTYILIGAREGNEEDEKDLEQRSNLFKKYGGEIKPIYTQGSVSGTKAREAAKQSKEAFYQFLPNQLSDSDKEEIYNIIIPTLNEVGEGSSKPYEWGEDFGEYFFTTDSGIKYHVFLEETNVKGQLGVAVEFSAKTPGMGGYSSKIEVGKGELFKVMATVIDIIKDYIRKDPDVEFIFYSPHKKSGEGDINNQRDKLYRAFIKKQIPGAEIKSSGNFIIAYLPTNQINENATYSSDIDYKQHIKELTKHMLKKGMNITPLPKVIFKHGDSSNARDFFGKTAYYDPNNQTIILYTEGRHPKDIVRSFSHEMIHHIQNLEGRLGDITTTNTQEDDNLNDIEAEANLKGTMTFRNWTDSLNEGLGDVSLDYIKTKLPKLDSYPKSDIILSKGDFTYINIPQDKDFGMTAEIKAFYQKDGTLVAQSSFDYDKNGKLKGTLDVRPDKRRMGIATEIYKLAEKIIGDTIFPEEKHTEDAEKFWRQKNRSFGPQNYDSLNEVKYTNPNFELEWEEAVRYPEFKEMGKENWIKVAKQGKLVNYSSIKDVLGNVDLNFDNLEEPKKQRFQSAFKNGTVETPIAVKFSDNDYDLVAGNTRLSGLVKNGEDPKILVINISNLDEKKSKDLFGLNQYARELAQGLEEEVFKASKIEKLLRQKYSEVLEKLFLFEKGDYIELNLIKIRPEHKGKGWATKILDDLSEYAQENNKILTLTPSDTFGASKSRLETFYKRFGFVPNKGKNKDFTTRDAMIRPLSEDTSELFTIYLDMDGVITDFDKRFIELAGMSSKEYEDSFGTEKFWDFIDIKHKVKFFSEMEWMPEGKKLYDFVKQFDHKLLSAPSKNDASKIGKRMWRKANTPETQLILSAAVNKKNYADKSNILIDDREKNIQQWKDAGGIGILFKSTDQVIGELKDIMNL